jgi:hypothetical protein
MKEVTMSNENLKYFATHMIAAAIGGLICCLIPTSKNKPSKHYPIEVQCYWSTNGYSSYPKMECDSINGDTIYKDGSMIVSKNIINVSYK